MTKFSLVWSRLLITLFCLTGFDSVTRLQAGGIPAESLSEASSNSASAEADDQKPDLSKPSVLLDFRKSWKESQDLPGMAQAQGGMQETFAQKMESEFGLLTCRLVVHDFGSISDQLFIKNKFQTEEAVKMPVAGPFFIYGQMNSGCDCLENQLMLLAGRTGLGCKFTPWTSFDFMLRGGPSWNCMDSIHPERMSQQAMWLIEVEANCPLAGPFKLEYQSTASQPTRLIDTERLKQDIRLALPLGSLGHVKFGAKHIWEYQPAAKSRAETTEVYVGVNLNR